MTCNKYGDSGASALRLHSLWVQCGVVPLELAALRKLTDLSFLEELFLGNEWEPSSLDFLGPLLAPIGTGTVLRDVTASDVPRLRRFFATSYTEEVHAFFMRLDDGFKRQLAISFTEEYTSKLIHSLFSAGLLPAEHHIKIFNPCFRMLDIELDLKALWSWTRATAVAPRSEERSSIAYVNYVKLVGRTSLEGLHSHLCEDERDDKPKINPSQIAPLGDTLHWFKKLTQLRVTVDHRSKTSPRNISLLAAQRLAKRLAALINSLRYIQVLNRSYRVCRRLDPWNVVLEELSKEEEDEVELFRHTVYGVQ